MGKDEDFLFPILVKKGAAISYEAARDQFRKGLKAAGIENSEKIRPPQYEKRFSHSSHPSRGLGSPGSETHEGSLQLHSQGYATLSHEKLGKISRVVFRASAQQH